MKYKLLYDTYKVILLIEILQYLASYWLTEGLYAMCKAHPMKCET